MSLTGSTANFGISSVNGIKMAADEVNAAGGINGKQIELLVQDDRSDASEAATIVTKFVTQDQVHAHSRRSCQLALDRGRADCAEREDPDAHALFHESGSDHERRFHFPQLLHRSRAGRGHRAVCR